METHLDPTSPPQPLSRTSILVASIALAVILGLIGFSAYHDHPEPPKLPVSTYISFMYQMPKETKWTPEWAIISPGFLVTKGEDLGALQQALATQRGYAKVIVTSWRSMDK